MDRSEKRFDLVKEAITQQITIASAILGAMIAFADKIAAAHGGRVWSLLPWATVPLAVSAIAGVLCLMSIAYYLGTQSEPLGERSVRVAGVVQNVAFLCGLIALVYVIAAS